MMYIPNRVHLCTKCGKTILYNEQYIGTDFLDANGEVMTILMHVNCVGLFSQAASGTSQKGWGTTLGHIVASGANTSVSPGKIMWHSSWHGPYTPKGGKK